MIITLFIFTPPVSGQTTEKINLVSSEALSNFPENVSFKLTVDSVEKIRSIKFFYRVNSSRNWDSVVKQFDNRYHITTEFVLNTSGSDFLTGSGLGLSSGAGVTTTFSRASVIWM